MATIDNAPRISLTGGGVGRVSGNVGGGLVGGAMQRLGASGLRAAELAGDISLDYQRRQNIREVNRVKLEYEAYKSNLLYGEGGLAHRNGNDAAGMTEQAARDLSEFLAKQTKIAPNNVVRDVLQSDLGKDIYSTTDLISRYEANKLENARQSDAVALMGEKRKNTIRFERDKLTDPARLEDTLADLEELIHTANPELGDEAVRLAALDTVREDAYDAVFAAMESGPAGIREALGIIEQYGDTWDPKEKQAAELRVTDEHAFVLTDQSVAAAGSMLGPDASEKELREQTVEQFSRAYERQFGVPPRQALIVQAENRASGFHRLNNQEIEAQREDKRARNLTSALVVLERGNPVEIDAAINLGVRQAIAASDFETVDTLQKMRANFEAGGSVHPKFMTAEGNALLFEAPRTKAEALAAAPLMKGDVWRRWAASLIEDPNKPSKYTSLSEITSQLNQVMVSEGLWAKGKAKTDPDFLRAFGAVLQLDARFVEEKKRRPDRDELIEMIQATSLSLDDPGRFDTDGQGGTLGDFLVQPGPLDLSQKRDKMVVDTALGVALQDPALLSIAAHRIGSTNSAAARLTGDTLAKDPQLVAELIRYALTTDRRLLFVGGDSSPLLRSLNAE